MSDYREFPPQEVKAYLDTHPEAQVLDVREPWEVVSGHVPKAVLIPLGSVPERYAELDSARPVVVICAGGVRSADACQFLASKGFADLINVAQGTKGWIRGGLPLEKPTPS